MSKVTCEKPKNSEYIIHSPRVPHGACFMAFPMRQDSMWVSSIWCSHCIPARGDHPQEVKYCSVATSHSPAHRVNCGWTAGQCYLSLRADHRDSALSWLRRRRAGICLRNEPNSCRRVLTLIRPVTPRWSSYQRLCHRMTPSMSVMGKRPPKTNANITWCNNISAKSLLCEILLSNKQIPGVPPNHLPSLFIWAV